MSSRDGELIQGDSGAAETVVEFDLAELFYLLLEDFKYIILAAVVCTVASWAVFHYMMKPTYSATAELYVTHSTTAPLTLSALQVDTFLTADYLEVFKMRDLQETVIKNLSLPYTVSQFRSMLTVTNPANTRILHITVQSLNPREAASIANEFASAARRYIAGTMGKEGPSVLAAAKVPGAPNGPDMMRILLIGFALGAGAEAGVTVLRYILNNRHGTVRELLQSADIPTLAVVPEIGKNPAAGTKAPIHGGKEDGDEIYRVHEIRFARR